MSDIPTTPPAEPTCPNCHQPGMHWNYSYSKYICNPQPRKEGDEPCANKNAPILDPEIATISPAQSTVGTIGARNAEQSSDPTVSATADAALKAATQAVETARAALWEYNTATCCMSHHREHLWYAIQAINQVLSSLKFCTHKPHVFESGLLAKLQAESSAQTTER